MFTVGVDTTIDTTSGTSCVVVMPNGERHEADGGEIRLRWQRSQHNVGGVIRKLKMRHLYSFEKNMLT